MVLIALVFAISGGIVYYRIQNEPKTYTSNFMKVEFTYPGKYSVFDDGLTDIKLVRGESMITIGRYGTNFPTADEHVKILVELNKIKVKNIQQMPDKYNSVLLESLEGKNVSRTYFFVKNYVVYHFSTDNPALFSDLDVIAKSLRIL